MELQRPVRAGRVGGHHRRRQEVAKAAGGDGIIVTGSNGDKDAITAVKDGRLTGTWDPDNIGSGMAAIKQMQTALAGGADKTYPR